MPLGFSGHTRLGKGPVLTEGRGADILLRKGYSKVLNFRFGPSNAGAQNKDVPSSVPRDAGKGMLSRPAEYKLVDKCLW